MNGTELCPLQRIIYFSPTLPLPNGSGIQKRAWSHLEALSRNAEVDLVLTLTSGQISRLDGTSHLAGRCRTLRILPVETTYRARNFKLPGLTTAIRLATPGQPASRLTRTADLGELHRDIANRRYDLGFFFRLRTFELVRTGVGDPRQLAPTIFLDLDDIESIALRREFEARARSFGFEERILAGLQQFETSVAERRALRRVDGVGICSDGDADHLRQLGTSAALVVVPNSLPDRPQLPAHPPTNTAKLLFLGTMTYQPNEDGIIYFCTEILPLIKRQARQPVMTEIVGRGPSKQVMALGSDDAVTVTGEVDAVEPCYERADIVIVPIRFGSGTRIKILEALALGRPVVSTSIGAEGLDLMDERDILIADDAESFAAACLRLMTDPALRSRIAQSGRQRFTERYESGRVQNNMRNALLSMRRT